ncbi:MAG: DUF1460 domain-containing protein [Deltaproteobacteria bacterium]|nr:DUF1460 domain-containing protein [Deltaproteobacteria bacterium]
MFIFYLLLVVSLIDLRGIEELISEGANLTFDKKLEVITSSFLNVPFKKSSIGEENEIDPDPIINLDYMDCVTFVEYVIAFVNSRDIKEFKKHVLSLRYIGGKIDFYNRLHLPDFQWFPNASKNGYISDITFQVGKGYVRRFKKRLDKDFIVDGYKIDSSKLISRDVEIDYIPKEHIFNVYKDIPKYSIIRILRKDSYRPFVTTHIGIVVEKGNKKYLRHSSRHFGAKVTDTPLGAYFSTLDKYENWEALGVALYKINDINGGTK